MYRYTSLYNRDTRLIDTLCTRSIILPHGQAKHQRLNKLPGCFSMVVCVCMYVYGIYLRTLRVSAGFQSGGHRPDPVARRRRASYHHKPGVKGTAASLGRERHTSLVLPDNSHTSWNIAPRTKMLHLRTCEHACMHAPFYYVCNIHTYKQTLHTDRHANVYISYEVHI